MDGISWMLCYYPAPLFPWAEHWYMGRISMPAKLADHIAEDVSVGSILRRPSHVGCCLHTLHHKVRRPGCDRHRSHIPRPIIATWTANAFASSGECMLQARKLKSHLCRHHAAQSATSLICDDCEIFQGDNDCCLCRVPMCVSCGAEAADSWTHCTLAVQVLLCASYPFLAILCEQRCELRPYATLRVIPGWHSLDTVRLDTQCSTATGAPTISFFGNTVVVQQGFSGSSAWSYLRHSHGQQRHSSAYQDQMAQA